MLTSVSPFVSPRHAVFDLQLALLVRLWIDLRIILQLPIFLILLFTLFLLFLLLIAIQPHGRIWRLLLALLFVRIIDVRFRHVRELNVPSVR